MEKKIEFEGSQGHKLAARLDLPDGEIKAYALFAHCFTCTKDIFAAGRIAVALNALNIAVLRFDFTGLGASEGEFENTNFTSNVQDLIKAADYMRENLEPPTIIIGHSLGGAAVLVAANDIPEIKAVATVAAPAAASHVAHHFEESRAEILEKGVAEVKLAGRPFKIQKQFIEDIESQMMDEHIRKLKKPLLVMHAPLDQTVGIENAEHIFKLAKHPKSFVTLDDADHLLSRRSDAAYAARVIAAWASRYVGYKMTPIDHYKKVDDHEVNVRSSGNGKFQQYVQMGKHFSYADEPESMGGDNIGPDPYKFLLAALGACTSMTLQMYARRKEWPLRSVEVSLKHQKEHAEDCQDVDGDCEKIDAITREIKINGEELDEKQRARLMEIADKCPVHLTLEKGAHVKTSKKT